MTSKEKKTFTNKIILITGGTGSFGQAFTKYLFKNHSLKTVRIFSRDELKQSEMAHNLNNYRKLRFLIGDIRDKDRLERAMEDVDLVVHTAALKQVPSCEYNPIEAIKTNIIGSQNVIEAALDEGVEKVILISSDKAVEPLNLYGATKLCAEKLFIQSNSYTGKKRTKFSVARYGNVLGSRGSVLPLFKLQAQKNEFTITHKNMTRFWITLSKAAEFVALCISRMQGGEVFVPKLKSLKIIDLARSLNKKAQMKIIGLRPGEKINEVLITENESLRTTEYSDYFLIQPEHIFWKPLRKSYNMSYSSYSSDTNKDWLDLKYLKKILHEN